MAYDDKHEQQTEAPRFYSTCNKVECNLLHLWKPRKRSSEVYVLLTCVVEQKSKGSIHEGCCATLSNSTLPVFCLFCISALRPLDKTYLPYFLTVHPSGNPSSILVDVEVRCLSPPSPVPFTAVEEASFRGTLWSRIFVTFFPPQRHLT